MAHPIKSVTNEAVLQALRNLGYQIPDIDMSGAQNSAWKTKLYEAMKSQFTGQFPKDEFDKVFNTGITVAKDLALIPPDAGAVQKLSGTLKAYGVEGEQLNLILRQAQKLGGTNFNEQHYADAVSSVLGNDSVVVRTTFQQVGLPPPRPVEHYKGAPLGSTKQPEYPGTPDRFAPQAKATGPAYTPPMAPPAPPPGQGTSIAAPALPGDVRAQDKKTAVTPVTGPKKDTATGAPKDEKKTLPGTGTVDTKGTPQPDYSKMNDVELEKELRRTFGKNVWIFQIPEIKKIVFDELRSGSGLVTQDIIDSAIQKTEWWNTNGEHVAKFLQEQATSAVGLNDKILGKQRQITERAAAYGMTLSPERTLEIATDWQKWNWDEDAVEAALAGEFDYTEGAQSSFISKLQADAKKYLVPLGEGTIDTWGKRLIEGGEAEVANWTEFLKQQAISMWPSLADRLNNNETTADIAAPYAKLAAQYLEIDEKDIDFMKPQWMTALDTVDDKGVHKSMAPADWVRKIKTDSVYRYDYTEQAKTQATGMATDLLKKFGVM